MRVLAIDGGGVRGLLPARVLAELERRTNRTSRQLFDLVVGTSTGGIIALALATPRPSGTEPWRAGEVVTFYDEQGPKIFARHRFEDAEALVHERYNPDGLEAALAKYFGDRMLSQTVMPVAVPTYDLLGGEPVILSSRCAADPDWDIPVRLAARATSAAPTYFPPLSVHWGCPSAARLFVDGGLVANNPSMCAYMEAQAIAPEAKMHLLSLGTGEGLHTAKWTAAHQWGLAQWARPLLHLVMNGASQIVHTQLAAVLNPPSYSRIQLELPGPAIALDDASPANLQRLHRYCDEMINRFDRDLDDWCHTLTKSD